MSTENDSLTTIRLEIPASYHVLTVIHTCLDTVLSREGNADDRQQLLFQVRLAVHETCTNIINHAYEGQGGTIRASFVRLQHPARIVIDLYDSGLPFRPPHAPAVNLDEARTSGYGLYLINQLLDQVIYETMPACNHWRLVKFLPDEIF